MTEVTIGGLLDWYLCCARRCTAEGTHGDVDGPSIRRCKLAKNDGHAMNTIFAIAGAFAVCSGLAVTALARWCPVWRRKLEDCGSSLFIAGLTLMGFAAPMM